MQDLAHKIYLEVGGYKIDGKYVELYGDKIQNQNNGGTSGTLKVAMGVTKYPYNGGTINGYKLYEYTLDPLEAGHYYYDVSKTGWCTYPPHEWNILSNYIIT